MQAPNDTVGNWGNVPLLCEPHQPRHGGVVANACIILDRSTMKRKCVALSKFHDTDQTHANQRCKKQSKIMSKHTHTHTESECVNGVRVRGILPSTIEFYVKNKDHSQS